MTAPRARGLTPSIALGPLPRPPIRHEMQASEAVPPLSPLLAIVGPTGSGKSDLALALAAEFDGEVVNFDSVQLYRGFNIGSAKLPPGERRGIPHHLLDCVNADVQFTAGEYARMAHSVIQDIKARGKLPVLAGGTGFYLRALLDGLSPAPVGQVAIRERLRQADTRRPGILHRFLRRFDPAAARRIHPGDVQKLSRAVEMAIAGRRPASAIQAEARCGLTGYRTLKLGLEPPRDILKNRLNLRAEAMFAHGLLEETERLLAAGVSSDSRPMGSLGYKQAA